MLDQGFVRSLAKPGGNTTGGAVAQQSGEHKLIPSQDIKWGPAPPSVPAGAQAAVLYGDPGKEGMFAFRLAEGLSHSSAYSSQARDRHSTLGNGALGHGNVGRPRQGSGSARGQLLRA